MTRRGRPASRGGGGTEVNKIEVLLHENRPLPEGDGEKSGLLEGTLKAELGIDMRIALFPNGSTLGALPCLKISLSAQPIGRRTRTSTHTAKTIRWDTAFSPEIGNQRDFALALSSCG